MVRPCGASAAGRRAQRLAEAERSLEQRQHDLAMDERDVLGTQVIRRNDALALLHEKIKITQRTVSQGQLAQQRKLDELRLLQLKLSAQVKIPSTPFPPHVATPFLPHVRNGILFF